MCYFVYHADLSCSLFTQCLPLRFKCPPLLFPQMVVFLRRLKLFSLGWFKSPWFKSPPLKFPSMFLFCNDWSCSVVLISPRSYRNNSWFCSKEREAQLLSLISTDAAPTRNTLGPEYGINVLGIRHLDVESFEYELLPLSTEVSYDFNHRFLQRLKALRIISSMWLVGRYKASKRTRS